MFADFAPFLRSWGGICLHKNVVLKFLFLSFGAGLRCWYVYTFFKLLLTSLFPLDAEVIYVYTTVKFWSRSLSPLELGFGIDMCIQFPKFSVSMCAYMSKVFVDFAPYRRSWGDIRLYRKWGFETFLSFLWSWASVSIVARIFKFVVDVALHFQS